MSADVFRPTRLSHETYQAPCSQSVAIENPYLPRPPPAACAPLKRPSPTRPGPNTVPRPNPLCRGVSDKVLAFHNHRKVAVVDHECRMPEPGQLYDMPTYLANLCPLSGQVEFAR